MIMEEARSRKLLLAPDGLLPTPSDIDVCPQMPLYS